MAAIQPKNTTDIKVDNIDEKTGGAGVDLNGIVRAVAAGALKPLSATVDLGTSTAAEHYREVFAKEVTSDGQELTLGTDDAYDVDIKRNGNVMFSLTAAGIESDATNGGSFITQKANTCVTGPHVSDISAAGSSISDATDLTGQTNRVTTVSASQGVQLWDAPIGATIMVWNSSGTACNVYPHDSSSQLNGGGAGTAKSLPASDMFLCFRKDATNWDVARIDITTA